MTKDEKTAKINEIKAQMEAVDAEYHRLTDPLREKMQAYAVEYREMFVKSTRSNANLLSVNEDYYTAFANLQIWLYERFKDLDGPAPSA